MVYEKIQKAIDLIKKSPLKKQGRNTYSEYDYYTPEQVNKLVTDACKELNLFHKFDLVRNEYGIEGVVVVIDLENNKGIAEYRMASDVPSIKATNIAQQLGGAMTYTKRYMLMNIFDIVDNNLDFDTTTNTKKQSEQKQESETPELPWLNRNDKSGNVLPAYQKVITAAKEKGYTADDLKKYYRISKTVYSELENDLQ